MYSLTFQCVQLLICCTPTFLGSGLHMSLNRLGLKLLFDWCLAASNHEVLILVKSRSVLQTPPPPSSSTFFSPLYRLLVQQGYTVSQSNYRSIKGFVAQPSFCQRSGRSRLRGLYRVRVNEISFHVEISWEKALKEGIGGKSLLFFASFLNGRESLHPHQPTQNPAS